MANEPSAPDLPVADVPSTLMEAPDTGLLSAESTSFPVRIAFWANVWLLRQEIRRIKDRNSRKLFGFGQSFGIA